MQKFVIDNQPVLFSLPFRTVEAAPMPRSPQHYASV